MFPLVRGSRWRCLIRPGSDPSPLVTAGSGRLAGRRVLATGARWSPFGRGPGAAARGHPSARAARGTLRRAPGMPATHRDGGLGRFARRHRAWSRRV